LEFTVEPLCLLLTISGYEQLQQGTFLRIR
jgi:hypothetical protein